VARQLRLRFRLLQFSTENGNASFDKSQERREEMNPKRIASTSLLAALAFCFVIATQAQSNPAQGQNSVKIKSVPVTGTQTLDGPTIIKSYCAVCHGAEGKGDGPAAAALKTRPADLTLLSKKNGGKFPSLEVKNYINGQDTVVAHGSRTMPIWGQVFDSINLGEPSGVKLRVAALLDHLEKMQTK
jgi:mono/diheme cytochrome c family protein